MFTFKESFAVRFKGHHSTQRALSQPNIVEAPVWRFPDCGLRLLQA
ncbi:hypothetical protein QWJ34_12645 [Saccharibacillus sp. CPCC 101409]|nr:hypothetical protein [Saccharibacillus sp. CPCC 101409]MDO3410612.1 hypothetical protein [Saccharibacillus sp. CPCC 101409]